MESQKRLLITGGAGYIGSQLVKKAVQAGLSVNVLDAVVPNNSSLESSAVKYFKGSIADSEILELCTQNMDYVIHLAGISDGKLGKQNPELTRQINIDTLGQILNISKKAGIKRFIFASTMGVYGNTYKIPLTEDLPLLPIDPYSESKAIGEQIVREANTDFFSTICLRMAMVYGVSERMKLDFIVNRLTIDAIEKKQLTIIGGDQKRPQIHIDDLCDVFIQLLEVDNSVFSNQVYNVVSQNPSIEDITTAIKKLIQDVNIQKLPGRKNEDSFEMDGYKLTRKTGITFKRSLETGIKEIIKNYATIKS